MQMSAKNNSVWQEGLWEKWSSTEALCPSPCEGVEASINQSRWFKVLRQGFPLSPYCIAYM